MPVRATELAPSGGVSIAVPDSWYEFDIHPATRDASIRSIVAERVRTRPELAPYRADITKVLRRMARDAWSSGAIYFGGMAEGFEGIPLTASLTVSVVSAADQQGRSLSTDPAAIVASLTDKPARGEQGTWRTVTTVEIPEVGTAARTFGVEDIEAEGDSRTFRVALMQTFVPVPGTPGTVAIISGSSPVLDLAESFLDLFDAITSTFRFVVIGGDPRHPHDLNDLNDSGSTGQVPSPAGTQDGHGGGP